jgi:hypothetical protein
MLSRAVFLNRRAAARYRVLTPIIPGRERWIFYSGNILTRIIFVNVSKSSDPERLNNICVANVSDQAAYCLYMELFTWMIGNFQTSKCLNIREREYRCLCSCYVINTYASLMYELKQKLERYLRVNLLGPGPSSYKRRIYRTAVSQRLGNTVI